MQQGRWQGRVDQKLIGLGEADARIEKRTARMEYGILGLLAFLAFEKIGPILELLP